MIIKEYCPSGSVGCGHWKLTNTKGTTITADDSDIDLREATEELEKDEEE